MNVIRDAIERKYTVDEFNTESSATCQNMHVFI